MWGESTRPSPTPTICHGIAHREERLGFHIQEAMSVVRREVKLSELDIKELRFWKAITGASLFEISGQDARSKASRLAERMVATLKDLPATVTVPRRTAELRMTGLEDPIGR